MKLPTLLISLLLLPAYAFTQTGSLGINTDGSMPHASAILDVKSTNQGVLIPRMSEAQKLLITTPATGLLIYQTDMVPGFYFYNSSTWINVSTQTLFGGSTGYLPKFTGASTLGNSLFFDNGTSTGINTNAPSGNFHVNSAAATGIIRLTSTTAATGLVAQVNASGASIINYENAPLFLGTNGTNKLVVTAGGNTGIGVINTNAKLQVAGNISLDDEAAADAPARIIGFPVNGPGNHNNLTIQAKNNTASGTAFVGGNLTLAAGDFNTSGASGSYGGEVIIRAGKNVFDGSGGGNIVLQAGGNAYTERMRITGSNGYVGIGTNNPTAKLHVAGSMKLVDGTQANGRILTSDASGNASWQAPSSTSRKRSVVIGVPELDNTNNISGYPGTKAISAGYQRPYLSFADNTFQQTQTTIPIPADWNGSSDFTLTVFYSTPGTAGNIDLTLIYITNALNDDMTGFTTSATAVTPASTTANGLSQVSFNLAYHFAASKILLLNVRRNGSSGTDTSTDPLHIHGLRLEYFD